MTEVLIIFMWTVLALLSLTGVVYFVKVTGKVIYYLSIDAIEIFTRWHTAQIDVDTRRAKLDYWQDYAHLALQERRQKLLQEGDK